jgi:hypothetical protein
MRWALWNQTVEDAIGQRPSTRRQIQPNGIDMTGQFNGASNSWASLDGPLAYLDQADRRVAGLIGICPSFLMTRVSPRRAGHRK